MKLNLGCGLHHMDDWYNVDRGDFPGVDLIFDLETFPWPWNTSSIERVLLKHVLEHLGQTTETYLAILGELWRVCENRAQIEIQVPHPHHHTFLGDPTHCRAVTAEQFALFDVTQNPDCPLRIETGIGFKVLDLFHSPGPEYRALLDAGKITYQEVLARSWKELNVMIEIKMLIEVVK